MKIIASMLYMIISFINTRYIGFFLIVLFSSILVGGCSVNTLGDPISLNEVRRLPLKKYDFDFSKTNETGELFIISQPASMQLMITDYNFTIGDQKIQVFKNSVTRLVLDKGSYKIPGGAGAFGLPTSTNISIQQDTKACLIFHCAVDIACFKSSATLTCML